MIFRRISYRIALQFTAFVFLLLLINGAIFLAVDLGNARRQTSFRLERMTYFVLDLASKEMKSLPLQLPPPLRERVRIVDLQGKAVYTGGVFSDIPFTQVEGLSEISVQNEEYSVLTSRIMQNTKPIGYMQVADIQRLPVGDLPERALMYLLVSGVISALTFVVGLFFARRSLKPAEEMVERLEQFTQDASHELRTPLAALSSSLDLALRTEQYREGIVSAKEDLHQVSALVERLLELARLDALTLNKEPIDLSALADSLTQRHRPLAQERSVSIEQQISPGITVKGDAMLLRQVFGNLLSNAIKFSKPTGGTIRVHLTKKEMTVEDTGIGIAKDTLPHIFDRFYQADASRAHGGAGLGLALVKRIVELHGWSITVKSKEREGTTVTIRFSSHL